MVPRAARPRSRRGASGVPRLPLQLDRGSLAIMFVLLFAMGLGATAGLLGSFQTLPPPSQWSNPSGIVLWILVAVGFATLVGIFITVRILRRRGQKGGLPEGAGASIVAFLLVVLIIFALVGVWSLSVPHRPNAVSVPGGSGSSHGNSTGSPSNGTGCAPPCNATKSNSTKGPASSPPLGGSSALPPLLLALAGGVVLSIIAVPLAVYLIRRGRPREVWEKEQPPLLVQTLQQAVASLEAGALGAAREKIVEAYAALLSHLKAEGVENLESLTPREIELLMETRLRLSSPSARGLRSLFEEARYSEHAMDERQAEAARVCLTIVLEELQRKGPPSVVGMAEGSAPPEPGTVGP